MSPVCITGARGTTESVCLRRNRREKKPRWNPLWNDECAVKHDTIPKKTRNVSNRKTFENSETKHSENSTD